MTNIPLPPQARATSNAVDYVLEYIEQSRALLDAYYSKRETLGALLDTAALMDPIPAYLQVAISDTERQIAALEPVEA